MFCVTLANDSRYVLDQDYSLGVGSDPIRIESRAEAEDMAEMINLTLAVMGHDDRAVVVAEGMDLVNRDAVRRSVVVLIDTNRGPRMLGLAEYFGVGLAVATDDGSEAYVWDQDEIGPNGYHVRPYLMEASRIGHNPRIASIL